MTIGDVLDQAVFDANETDPDYRNAARRWLNAARSYIAQAATWQCAVRPTATINTSAATTSGIYTLVDSLNSTAYEFVRGPYLYDETNENTITHESYMNARDVDHAKSTTGPPTVWADAGCSSAGARQIYLWPVPSATYTVTFPGVLLLQDVSESDETLAEDPYYGPVLPWAPCFFAGMRYYHDLYNNEDPTATELQRRNFDMQIKRRQIHNSASSTRVVPAKIVQTRNVQPGMGRLNPAHYDNSRRGF